MRFHFSVLRVEVEGNGFYGKEVHLSKDVLGKTVKPYCRYTRDIHCLVRCNQEIYKLFIAVPRKPPGLVTCSQQLIVLFEDKIFAWLLPGSDQHAEDRRHGQILQRRVDHAMETVHAQRRVQRPEWSPQIVAMIIPAQLS